ncbi:diguanylate cyclase [Rhabdochromatium marinum]|uniref:diguanylate cyclase n=1 Tax=Rhabdochromatium marinum TaxID=48729 RepID=UPI001905BCF5|nr:diguanylate cyclase [Rhabdochromatium marinum]MBK1650124.1 hypothetical protein [Rhabdochromatium marinum]
MPGSPLKLKSSANAVATTSLLRNWNVLVVDDDVEVHTVTRMILSKMRYKERGITILSAYSAAEAHALLQRERDIAAILLDVVMETDDAGLRLVKTIREELGNSATRIILRTGQPGQAPEERVIVDYDINDYKAKSELTAQKLFTTVMAALRSFETIVSLEKTRNGLEKILDSTDTLFQVHSLQQFASGVLTQLSAFLGCQPNGVIYMQRSPVALNEDLSSCNDMTIMASSGEYRDCLNCTMDGDCKHQNMLAFARQALVTRQNQLGDEYTAIYLGNGDNHATVALLHEGLGVPDASDRKLLEVFSSKIAIALANALNYQKMVTAEQAATTDFLTGLDNRRQLLRLGLPLVARAHRAGTSLAVAMLDIDHFKRINDTWGHDAGDEVLSRVGQMMKTRFRNSDVVARFGGEEFCVIATDLTPEAALTLLDHFRRQVAAEIFEFDADKLSITISIGVTTKVQDNIDAMIIAADNLLYRAKETGRNRVLLD